MFVLFVPRTTSPALLTATCSHFLIGGRVVVGCRVAKRRMPRDGSRLIATPSTPGRPNPTNGSINPIKKVEPPDPEAPGTPLDFRQPPRPDDGLKPGPDDEPRPHGMGSCRVVYDGLP